MHSLAHVTMPTRTWTTLTHRDAVDVSGVFQLQTPLEVGGQVEAPHVDATDADGTERFV